MINICLLLFTGMSACLNTSMSPQLLSTILNANSDFSTPTLCGTLSISLTRGNYIRDDIEIAHRLIELTGQPWKENDNLKTRLIASPQSDVDEVSDERNNPHIWSCIFSLTNSTLSLKWMDVSLVDNSIEGRQQMSNAEAPRLATVSSSMLTISDSRLEVSPWTSAIVISGSIFDESAPKSSVVVQKCSIWNDIGEMRGVVETSAFPDIGTSPSISIVGCSFDSLAVLGNDGIGLSLTRTARKRVEIVGRISTSLIGCSFVNMSSIGSSRQPQLSHLNQKMLGCVVSLTSSHLSGSTIRDVNNGGSLLCSNSSFSSLLSSPHTDTNADRPTVVFTPGEYTAEDYEDGTRYILDKDSGDASSITSFSHCVFTGSKYESTSPLSISDYKGTFFILSCSFTGVKSTALYVVSRVLVSHTYLTINSTNFTSCSSWSCGATYINQMNNALVHSCRFEDCSATNGEGGGLYLHSMNSPSDARGKQFQVVDCLFADCTAKGSGGGISTYGYLDLSVVGTKFEWCESVSEYDYEMGGGIRAYAESALTVERSQFIQCSSKGSGGAIAAIYRTEISLSDLLVKNCHSETIGAISISRPDRSKPLSFSRLFFDGNSIGEVTTFNHWSMNFKADTTKFTDLIIMYNNDPPYPTFTFDDCYTTTIPDSTGMYTLLQNPESGKYEYGRYFNAEFNKIGPFLTSAPTTRMNGENGKIEMEIEGKTPLTSQEYEVRVSESDGTETGFRMLFSDGTGTLVSGSEDKLKFNTSYTITSIVGIVPSSSSSSSLSNGITIPFAAWAFNISLNPSFLTFTTPPPPPTLDWSISNLAADDSKFAYVILVFSEKVKGSYEIVVEERGKDVTLTVPILEDAKGGESGKFIVVGEDRLLTHDTTYTIKSIDRTPGTDSMFVLMNETITFHIPKSTFDPKKSMSPETKRLLSWMIPVIACVLVGVVLAIVIDRVGRREIF
ncbi:hypothetical protein BLNAU_10531 [Blattamonas nauphoetae]|uniref:Uncharacterized protein n=1 Tax=Blattamonas nauphoetae TaxID=2049346 RepID=A0ABQ9XQV0_9EUKA|nr:hypothetical protein BLNAU_10531 [Blattamonas nauphoetae]